MDKQKQIEEMAEEKSSKQWQRRDEYCLRIQKATQYKGDSDHEDVPSILVDYEKEIKKELIPENAVVFIPTEEQYALLSKEEYERLQGQTLNIQNVRKETAEKFAELADEELRKLNLEMGGIHSKIFCKCDCIKSIYKLCNKIKRGKI